MAEKIGLTPEEAHTNLVVSAVRMFFNEQYGHCGNQGAIDYAIGIMEQEGFVDEDGRVDIPMEWWSIINADLEEVQQ